MIRTNLSTRPFYNARAVHVLLTALTVIVLAAVALAVWARWRSGGWVRSSRNGRITKCRGYLRSVGPRSESSAIR